MDADKPSVREMDGILESVHETTQFDSPLTAASALFVCPSETHLPTAKVSPDASGGERTLRGLLPKHDSDG
jgi:hypothetical protein